MHLYAAPITLLLATAASAATPDADTAVVVLREAVVTTAKQEVSSAAPLFGYDAERLGREGVQSVADAVHRLPGVTLRDYGGAGGLKTVQVRGFGAGHTSVSYDGVPLSNVQTGQIDISRYSISNISNLALTVGDNDDIFLPATLAASASRLSIVTEGALADSLALRGQVRVGSWGLVSPFARVAAPLGERVTLSAVGEYTHADNDYPYRLANGSATTTERRTNSRMDSGHGEIDAQWRIPGGGGTLTAKAYYYANNQRLPGPALYYNPESNEALRQSNAAGQAVWRRSWGEKWLMMAQGRYDYSYQRYTDQSGIYPGGLYLRRYAQRQTFLSATAMFMPSRPWAIAYSADYALSTLRSNQPNGAKPLRHSILQSLTGRYRQGAVSVMARMLLSAYRHRGSLRSATRLSPSASVSVQPWRSRQLYLRASYKEIFRMPSFSEAYFDHYGSEQVLPESTRQFNLGITYSAPRWITLTADAYINKVSDMIVAVPYNMFVWRVVNMGRVRVLGIDVTVAATLPAGLSLNANVTYQRAQARTSRTSAEWNKQIAYIPRITGNFALSWENPWVCLTLSGTGVGERFTSATNSAATRLAPYFELGAAAWRSFALRGHSLTARLAVQNLLNSQYQVVARYPMPGRAFTLTLEFNI